MVEQRLQAFSRIFHFAVREGWIAERPQWKRRTVYEPTPEQLEAARVRHIDRLQATIDARRK